MGTSNKILLALLLILILIQFIRPAKNLGQAQHSDIANQLRMPLQVESILKTACYDCHSNTTHYPRYAYVQPLGWLLSNHIREGKDDLNFNEFGSYSKRMQLSKLRAIGSSVKDGSMPLTSYTFLHQDAKLSMEARALVINWAANTRDSLEATK